MRGYSKLQSLCLIILIFITTLFFTSCQEARVVDSFPAPVNGGLAFDGTYLWLGGGDTIWQLDTSGQIIEFFDAPGKGARGLAFGETYIFASRYDMIYKLDTEMNIIDSFETAIIAIPRDIAFDGTYLWLVDYFADNLYKLDTSGNPIDVFDAPCKSPFGLGFDGTYLWLACYELKWGSIATTMLYKLDTTGNIIDSFYGPGDSPLGIACDDSYLWLVALDIMTKDPTIYKLDISN